MLQIAVSQLKVSSVFITLFALISGAAIADPVARCDELAASPFDPDRRAEPVQDNVLHYGGKRSEANAACEEALARYPDNLRLMMQLGRTQYRTQNMETLGKAAAMGSGTAAYHLALWHNRRGPDMSYYKVDKYLQLGVELGHPYSHYMIGLRYQLGQPHGRVDLKRAAEWYSKAAELDVPDAAYRLGLMYRDGQGVDADANEAVRLLKLAAEGGVERAQGAVASLQNDSPLSRNKDVPYAEVLKVFADLGDTKAQYNLGVLYETGDGIEKNYRSALAYYDRARADFHGKAAYAQGRVILKMCSEERFGCDSDDYEMAAHYFSQAARLDPAIQSEATNAAAEARDAMAGRGAYSRTDSSQNPALMLMAAIVVFGLLTDSSGGGSSDSTFSAPEPYDPCSNPFYADAAGPMWCGY